MVSFDEDSPEGVGHRPAGTNNHNQGPPRKRMRKGTKSCLECRRRKIKCTFDPPNSAVCKECYARGSTCIDQEHGELPPPGPSSEQAYSLRERVTELEGMVKDMLHRIPENASRNMFTGSPATMSTSDTQSAAEVLKSLRDPSFSRTDERTEDPLNLPIGLRDGAPALSLFDNAVITRSHEPTQLPKGNKEKNARITRALTDMLPGPEELDELLEISNQWWTAWSKMFPEIADSNYVGVKEAILKSLASEKPAEVAKMILCLAVSIDQLPGDWDFSKLHLDTSPQELMERYITTVDELVTSDDEIAATIDGIECLCLQAKYHVNIGRPRRAWLLFRRAISFAQLLGLHRLAIAKPTNPTPEQKRLLILWAHIFQGDRYMALTLGLPCTIGPEFCDPLVPKIGEVTDMSEGDVFLLRLSPICAAVAERNQKPIPDFSATLRIDEQMGEIAQTVSQDWWGKTDVPAASSEERMERLLSQFFFNIVRSHLHLPFMLKSPYDKRYEYSYSAALDSSRGVLRYYDALRGVNASGPFVCKVVDFQAFTCAMLILLHLYGAPSGTNRNPEQDQLDSDLVDTTIEILRKASNEAGGIIARQSLKALELMALARQGCQEAYTQTMQLTIPYFGTITIGAGKSFRAPPPGKYPPKNEMQLYGCDKLNHLTPSQMGLPTPPSASGSISHFSPPSLTTDPSCSSANTSVLPSPYTDALPYRDPSQPSKGPNSLPDDPLFSDDPLITFDSYAANPHFGSGGGLDLGFADGTFQMGLTPAAAPAIPGLMDINGMPGFPWLGAGLDLDTSWNWFGNEGFAGSGQGQGQAGGQ